MIQTFLANLVILAHLFAVILPLSMVTRFATIRKTTLAIAAKMALTNYKFTNNN
jgi:hypothetical protein